MLYQMSCGCLVKKEETTNEYLWEPEKQNAVKKYRCKKHGVGTYLRYKKTTCADCGIEVRLASRAYPQIARCEEHKRIEKNIRNRKYVEAHKLKVKKRVRVVTYGYDTKKYPQSSFFSDKGTIQIPSQKLTKLHKNLFS